MADLASTAVVPGPPRCEQKRLSGGQPGRVPRDAVNSSSVAEHSVFVDANSCASMLNEQAFSGAAGRCRLDISMVCGNPNFEAVAVGVFDQALARR